MTMFHLIAIAAGVVLGLFGLGVVDIWWWLHILFKDWDWNTW